MKKSKSNAGFSTMEIIIAAVILAVVVVGVLVAIKLVSKGNSSDPANVSAQKRVESVSDRIRNYVADADLDITFSDNTLRLVSRKGYQVIFFDTASGKIYFQDKTYASADTDAAKIKTASNVTLDAASAEVMATEVVTFLVTTTDLSQEGATMKLKLRVNTAEENYTNEFTYPVNADLIALKNGTYVDLSTVTPVPTKNPEATATPKPTATPEPVAAGTTTLLTNNGSISWAKLTAAPADAKIEIICVCEDTSQSGKGYGVGGIAISNWTVSNFLTATLKEDPVEGQEYTFEFPVSNIIAIANEAGTEVVNVNFYNGFTIRKVNLVVE